MLVFVIKEIRMKKNISLYKLSQMTDISRTYLRKIENNEVCNPSLHILQLIADALDVGVKSLFYETIEIKALKKELNKRIDKYGLNSPEVLEISQIIDLLINIDMNENR